MEVFDWEVVQKHKEACISLMASENFDAAFAMAEDEFSLCGRLPLAAHTLTPPPGKDQCEYVVEKVLPLVGNRWSPNDLGRLWNFSATTDPVKITFLQALARYIVDSTHFRISSSFFGKVGGTSVKLQGIRAARVAAQLSSEELEEFKEHSSRRRRRRRRRLPLREGFAGGV